MARLTSLVALFALVLSVSATPKSVTRTSRSLRHHNVASVVTRDFPEPAFVDTVEDVDEKDWEKESDFVDASKYANEFIEEIGDQELHFEEEESLEKRASFVKVSKPSNLKSKMKGLASWFRTNHGSDFTNGKSWCGVRYKDNMMGFAVNFDLLSKSHAVWSTDPQGWIKAGKKYCGLEAEVTYKGKKTKMYIMDAFDTRFVRTKYAVDIIKGAFEKIYRKNVGNNKNIVIKDLQWRLTGRRNKQYAFQG